MSAENPPEQPPSQIKFHQIKGNFFRAIHADGALLSVHPNECVHLTFFNERIPIATEVVNNLTVDGKLSGDDPTKTITKKGFVREIEVDVIVSRRTAEALHAWLTTYIEGTLPRGNIPFI